MNTKLLTFPVPHPRAAPLVAALTLALAAPAAAHHVEKRFPVTVRPMISVRNDHGTVTVKSWQKSEVQIIANYTSDRVEVDADQAGNRIDVITHRLAENVPAAELRVEYEITVPEDSELQIRTDSGNVNVERVFGDMTFDTVTANLELKEVSGYLVIKTMSGSLLCDKCAGPRLEITTVSGYVRLLQPVSSNVRVRTTTGDIFFNGDFLRGGSYLLKTGSGQIEVQFSDTDSFELVANTLYGKLDKDPSLNLQPSAHSRTSAVPKGVQSFAGKSNEGLAHVELSSFNGTIRLRKRQ
jgi:DUF4097 and DUF4098 domain-containing protein YvlB